LINKNKEDIYSHLNKFKRHQWLMPVILVTQEEEIRRITVQSHPRQTVCETLSQKTLHKNRAGGVVQGEGPEFKAQYRKKKKIQINS
jgi:hypothetical protein